MSSDPISQFMQLRVMLIELVIIAYAIGIVMTVIGTFLYTLVKYLIPYIFYKIDPDFIKALFVYEKKELKSQMNTLLALIFIILALTAAIFGMVMGTLLKRGYLV